MILKEEINKITIEFEPEDTMQIRKLANAQIDSLIHLIGILKGQNIKIK